MRGPAAAARLSALTFLPVGIVLAACVLSSAVPYLADLVTLRRVPAQTAGPFVSITPVLAAVVG
ncbi:hypothetical protein GCM10023323_40160 [Streptomyces thinghirensis]|uniref:MFS transporter n=1 Tax=Streptomyces thinghirensis TaxID=551547 RepID=A0ABP9T7R1_9ACTN